jgi:hypothetical protein
MKRILILAVLLAGCQPERSEPKPAPVASFAQGSQYRLDVAIDPDTGCQYLQQDYKGITPRIAADGKTHMGCKGTRP